MTLAWPGLAWPARIWCYFACVLSVSKIVFLSYLQLGFKICTYRASIRTLLNSLSMQLSDKYIFIRCVVMVSIREYSNTTCLSVVSSLARPLIRPVNRCIWDATLFTMSYNYQMDMVSHTHYIEYNNIIDNVVVSHCDWNVCNKIRHLITGYLHIHTYGGDYYASCVVSVCWLWFVISLLVCQGLIVNRITKVTSID